MRHLLIFLFLSVPLLAQNYDVGFSSYEFTDPDRGDRPVGVELFFPQEFQVGEVANGQFPLIVFGHGFAMDYNAYSNWIERLVPAGFILAFPTTESGLFSVNHAEFAADISYTIKELKTRATQEEAILFNHLSPNVGVIGHSMGGGASFLAAGNGAELNCLIGLAPAETDPSAIAQAVNVSVPTLILSGTGDAVTPPNEHHLPIFEALPEIEKIFISIEGGAHCYFANTNLACDFGEGASGGDISIDREQQQQITFDFVRPFLDFHLKANCSRGTEMAELLQDYPGITATHNFAGPELFYPVIQEDDSGNLFTETGTNFQWLVNGNEIEGATEAQFYATEAGSYQVQLINELGCSEVSEPFIISTTLGLNTAEKHIRVFPNPAMEHTTISIPHEMIGSDLRIYNRIGQPLLAQEITSRSQRLALSHLPIGCYRIVISGNKAQYRLSLLILE